jgi:hypothetical protein
MGSMHKGHPWVVWLFGEMAAPPHLATGTQPRDDAAGGGSSAPGRGRGGPSMIKSCCLRAANARKGFQLNRKRWYAPLTSQQKVCGRDPRTHTRHPWRLPTAAAPGRRRDDQNVPGKVATGATSSASLAAALCPLLSLAGPVPVPAAYHVSSTGPHATGGAN